MNEPYVVARQVAKSFGARPVLSDVSFEVAPGDVVGVLGKNGAGKTTLLEVMLGFSSPTSGSVRIFGEDSLRLSGAAKARIGFVPQQDELVNALTVADQIGLIASFYPRWDDALLAQLSRAWEVDLRARVRTMSVGQRQKLSILLALGHRPDLLLLDEPVASLDPLARRQFLEQIVDVAADGRRAVVLSSHIVSDIERLANKIWILKDGRLHWRGDLDALRESIVRLHVRARSPLPRTFVLPNALSTAHGPAGVTAIVADFDAADCAQIARAAGAEIEVETLALEEIFLELHR